MRPLLPTHARLLSSWPENSPSRETQVGKLPASPKFCLRLDAFIWYKQFTESSVWLAGRFCRNSRRSSGIYRFMRASSSQIVPATGCDSGTSLYQLSEGYLQSKDLQQGSFLNFLSSAPACAKIGVIRDVFSQAEGSILLRAVFERKQKALSFRTASS